MTESDRLKRFLTRQVHASDRIAMALDESDGATTLGGC